MATASMARGLSRMSPFSLARLTVGGEGSGCKPDQKRRQQIVKLRRRGFTFKRIAEQLGMQYQGVQRMAQTIPGYIPILRRWTEAEVALLGTMPDPDLAERIGSTFLAVRMKRLQSGIPAKRRRPAG
jgi:hypothetical protein